MKSLKTTALLCFLFGSVFLSPVVVQTAEAAIRLDPVLQGLSSPVYVTGAHDGTNRLFVVEQPGRIQALASGAMAPSLFVDITSKVLSGGEQGLLGLAFHPQFATNSRFFVNYTRQTDGATVIAEYHAQSDPIATAASENILLTIAQPYANHNGGMIEFGPDGYLYIGMGDGGSANDPESRAQNINELLGKILRIDVDHPSGGQMYSSPPGNPFLGATPGRDEIFAVGMRNPFRFSFDRQTGQLYVGDVGQDALEEVDIVTAGGNYGWRVFEGTSCTNLDPELCNPSNYVPPIAQYGHTAGRCSIIGGYVYRGGGGALPVGTYVFGDYCTGEIFSLENGVPTQLLDTAINISSFGEDDAREIYVAGLDGTVHRIASASRVATATTLTSSANPAPVSSTVTFTATVMGVNPTGVVNFTDGGASISGCAAVALGGTGNSRIATCSTSSLAAGTHTIVAAYGGDAGNTESSSPPILQSIDLAGETLGNGGFEAPNLAGSYQYLPSGATWVFTGGAGITGNGNAFTSGNGVAPEGSQVAFLQGNGMVAQTVNLTAGSYTLSFQAAQRGNYQVGTQIVLVQIDGVTVGQYQPPNTTYSGYTTPSFTIAGSDNHTIALVGAGSGTDFTAFIDDVRLTAGSTSSFSNGGFESPNLAGAYRYAPPGATWVFTAAGITGNSNAFTSGNSAAPEGSQVAFLQGHGMVAQTANLSAGSYTLSFQSAQRGNYQVGTQIVLVQLDGATVGQYQPPGTAYSGYTTPAFTVASSGSHTIALVGAGSGTDFTAFIDDVRLNAASTPALGNSGFEAPNLAGAYQYSPSGAAWIFTGGAGITGNGNAFTNGNGAAPEGSQVGFLQGNGMVAQTVNLAAGSHTLSFQSAQRGNHQIGTQVVLVQLDGVTVGQYQPPGTAYSGYTTPSFTVASSGSHTISLMGAGSGSDFTAFVDDVRLQ
jgi:glucose/arabinose dehydrogenase